MFKLNPFQYYLFRRASSSMEFIGTFDQWLRLKRMEKFGTRADKHMRRAIEIAVGVPIDALPKPLSETMDLRLSEMERRGLFSVIAKATSGDASAQIKLASYYQRVSEYPGALAEAYCWLLQAVKKSPEDAKVELDALVARMDPSDIAEGTRRSEERNKPRPET